MIKSIVEKQIVTQLDQLMIPADNVAHVLGNNSLSHGMLVLSTVKYSLIPVLSPKSQLLGLVSMPMMIKAVTTVDEIDTNKLDTIKIDEVMMDVPVKVEINERFEKILHHLVDHNFICVVDDEDTFLGIITRRTMLKHLNHFLHQLSKAEQLESVLLELNS